MTDEQRKTCELLAFSLNEEGGKAVSAALADVALYKALVDEEVAEVARLRALVEAWRPFLLNESIFGKGEYQQKARAALALEQAATAEAEKGSA